MTHNILHYIGCTLATALMVVSLAACSSDDDYQAAAPLSADNEQVHFAGDNEETVILDPSNKSSYNISVKVLRNTRAGRMAVPVQLGSGTTAGVTASDSVVFANGDSVATMTVTIPDTARSGQTYQYSLELKSDQTDPYSYLGGGIIFNAKATVPNMVKLKCWIDQYATTTWEESAIDFGDGSYRISNFMNSGYALDLTINGSKLNVGVPSGSPIYTEANYYGLGTDIYWYTDDYVHLYPYGKDGGTDIDYLVLLNNSDYDRWYSSDNCWKIMLTTFKTTTMADAVSWVYFCFQIE